MQEKRLGKNSDNLVKIFLNEKDDYIVLDKNDTSLTQKFAQFVSWLDEKQKELKEKEKEIGGKYEGKPMASKDEDGNVSVDAEQFLLLSQIRVDLFKECVERIDLIFGKDTIRKYFYSAYEHIPDYVPDDAAISDFLDEIAPVLEEIYKEKIKRMNSRYSKNRKGKHTKTKEEILEEMKENHSGAEANNE